eukprot:jgi/Chlat1/5691/Chrsp38S05520
MGFLRACLPCVPARKQRYGVTDGDKEKAAPAAAAVASTTTVLGAAAAAPLAPVQSPSAVTPSSRHDIPREALFSPGRSNPKTVLGPFQSKNVLASPYAYYPSDRLMKPSPKGDRSGDDVLLVDKHEQQQQQAQVSPDDAVVVEEDEAEEEEDKEGKLHEALLNLAAAEVDGEDANGGWEQLSRSSSVQLDTLKGAAETAMLDLEDRLALISNVDDHRHEAVSPVVASSPSRLVVADNVNELSTSNDNEHDNLLHVGQHTPEVASQVNALAESASMLAGLRDNPLFAATALEKQQQQLQQQQLHYPQPSVPDFYPARSSSPVAIDRHFPNAKTYTVNWDADEEAPSTIVQLPTTTPLPARVANGRRPVVDDTPAFGEVDCSPVPPVRRTVSLMEEDLARRRAILMLADATSPPPEKPTVDSWTYLDPMNSADKGAHTMMTSVVASPVVVEWRLADEISNDEPTSSERHHVRQQHDAVEQSPVSLVGSHHTPVVAGVHARLEGGANNEPFMSPSVDPLDACTPFFPPPTRSESPELTQSRRMSEYPTMIPTLSKSTSSSKRTANQRRSLPARLNSSGAPNTNTKYRPEQPVPFDPAPFDQKVEEALSLTRARLNNNNSGEGMRFRETQSRLERIERARQRREQAAINRSKYEQELRSSSKKRKGGEGSGSGGNAVDGSQPNVAAMLPTHNQKVPMPHARRVSESRAMQKERNSAGMQKQSATTGKRWEF